MLTRRERVATFELIPAALVTVVAFVSIEKAPFLFLGRVSNEVNNSAARQRRMASSPPLAMHTTIVVRLKAKNETYLLFRDMCFIEGHGRRKA
jgi:hypothetical protein